MYMRVHKCLCYNYMLNRDTIYIYIYVCVCVCVRVIQ